MYKTPIYQKKSSGEAGPAQRPAIETIPRQASQSIPEEELYAPEKALYNFLRNVTERI